MSDETLFRILPLAQQGYCCSQIILLLGLEAQGRSNSGLIRAAAGLCHGIGGGHSCGALTGAACLLALYAGKGTAAETEDERLPVMLESLSEWFAGATADYGGVGCADILGDQAGQPNQHICGQLIAATVDQSLTILLDNGIDPSEPADEGS